jgi:SpoIIAA-like
MIDTIPDMPPGTLGFRAHGHVTREDYTDVFLPPIKEKVDSGEGIRLLYQVGPDFDKFEAGALVEDAKTGWNLGIRHPDAWKRVAFVTDVHWMAQATHAFAWMMPGELKLFPPEQIEEAKSWVAASTTSG